MSGGWIKVHRKILDNDWLCKSRTYSNFEAFMFLLLKANHKEGSFHIGTQVVEVKRGQLITSQKKLCKQFNWSNSKLRNYLKTAKNASMIHTETTSKTTCLTILNYDTYQCTDTEETLIKIWDKLSKENKELILKNTPNYVLHTVKTGEGSEKWKPKRKHPSTYLNQQAWNDEIVVEDNSVRFKVDDYVTDGGGVNKIGYCEVCLKHDFYTPKEVLFADSRCCSKKVIPNKEMVHA